MESGEWLVCGIHSPLTRRAGQSDSTQPHPAWAEPPGWLGSGWRRGKLDVWYLRRAIYYYQLEYLLNITETKNQIQPTRHCIYQVFFRHKKIINVLTIFQLRATIINDDFTFLLFQERTRGTRSMSSCAHRCFALSSWPLQKT